MEKDISKGTIVGLLILFGLVLSVDAQCTEVINCKSCVKQNGIDICLTCNDDFGQNADRTACCSKGCPTDDLTHLSCDVTDGRCATSDVGCKSGYIGEFCERCSETIQNCDDCWRPPTSSVNECLQCATNFYLTTDQQHCCPQGCDTCTGTAGTICTSCKPTYFLYNDGCDRCGHNCVAPADGSARCNPSDGECYLGCIDGWHGPKCDVECTLNRCERCAYDTDTLTLTCADCALGYYDSFCVACGAHCSPATAANLELCYQDGTCANGCQPGYRGNQCDIACDSAVNLGNCEECDRYAFKCTKCKPNYWGDQCQNVCNQNCVLFGGARSCSIDQGSCDFGCLAGYYKPDCSGSCPFCGNDVCDRTTGDCLDPVCDPGYYGFNCNFTCPSNCVSDFSGKSVCDFQYGNCTNGCIDGKWEAFCNQGCSVNCAASPAATETGPLCEQKTGRCLYQCKPGYFHQDCREPCESRCVDDRCDITAGTCLACNETNPGYLCPEGICPVGKYGQFCQVDCTGNCILTCGRYNGTCFGCDQGYHDSLCDLPCGQCSSGTCDQKTGLCATECNPGYWNMYCNQTCLHDGCEKCFQDNGQCETCDIGLYGFSCSSNCSNFCARDSFNQIVCEKSNGYCSEGKCLPGYWNRPCDAQCNENCLANSDGAKTCSVEDGNCDFGCKPNYYGGHCDLRCSVTCFDQLCEWNGLCSNGCVVGAYGSTCELSCKDTCNDGKCDQVSGECSECDKPFEDQTELCRTAECKPIDGVFYHGLNCSTPCPEGCASTCQRYSGVCDACKAGLWSPGCLVECGSCEDEACFQNNGTCLSGCTDGFYGLSCVEKCDSACESCDRISRSCLTCKQGLWGENCREECSEACIPSNDGYIYCEKDTGECSPPACIIGYYGPQCSSQCSANCLPPSFSTSGVSSCGFESGICDAGCKTGWYGDFCNSRCSFNCVENTCYRNGSCDFQLGCADGFYGFDCTDSCVQVCNDGTCDRGAGNCTECSKPVDEQSPRCRSAACSPVDTFGLFCQFPCPTNCADGTCARDDGTCTACKPTKYGMSCNKSCPNCGTDKCSQTNGVCIDSCDPGWYQLDCMKECKHEGCFDCDRNNGECISCKPGKYGTNCSLDCAATCKSDKPEDITCNRFSGECDSKACEAGYYTPQCTKRCSQFCQAGSCDIDSGTCAPCVNGWYGQRCDGECSNRCKNKDCEVLEDSCRLGCTDGYWGGSCEKTCNINCDSKACAADTAACLYGCNATKYYGMTCAEPCNGNCVDDICNRTGYCLKGCEVGWYGDQCQYTCRDVSKCTDGTCERLAGVCADCNTVNPGPNCPTADCPQGKRGNACEVNCTSTNCLYNQCGRYTDKCNGCPSGYYGDKCELTCSRCKAGTGCNQETGVCDAGCRDGWYRPDCETNCSNVCGSCERQSGECVTCAAGRWGTTCSLTCSSNCVQTITNGNNMVFCDKASGKCREQACKVGFWREDCTQACNSNCLQDENNNRICEYLDGECTRGCKDKFYGKTCSGLCSTRCRNQLCTGFEDTCDLGCADGYYGATCSGICSSHCAGQGRCDPGTGRCFDGCELGYYGLRCDDQCKNTCIDGTCNDEGGCTDCGLDPVGPNCRVQVCDPGKYGPTCESDCPGNYCLNNQCKRTTGTCETGCLENYYGSYCTEVCKCDLSGTSECEQEKGECVCRPGSHGVLCNERCSTGCVDDKCDRDGECSQGCRSGRYGSKCEDTCSNCLNENCNSANGNCNDGCTEGWHGPRCNLPCKTECRTCDIQTGECTSCINNYYSFPACDKSCSTNCNTQGSNRTCNQVNGDCVYGCKTGFYSLDCSESCGNCDSCNTNDGSCPTCNVGWWGTTCKVQCSSNCARGGSSNERMCSQSTGYCEFGCEVGYYGDTCSSTCNSPSCANRVCDRQTGTCTAGCLSYFYGTNCDQKCDNCKEGNCEQANGKCVGDCPANAYGDQCEKECLTPLCTDATCDRYSGYCTDCQISPKGSRCSVQDSRAEAQVDEEVLKIESIVGITVGSVAFVIVFVVVLVCCMNYKRRYDDAKTEIHLPSDVIERLSTHRSLHSTTSTNYPVARVVGDDEKDFVLF